jgi:hypothetical protein
MRSLLIGLLILTACGVSQPLLAGGGGGQPEGDEISMVVLDELFSQASKEWNTTSDAVWDAYSSGKLTVKSSTTSKQSFNLHSDSLGDLTVSLQGENQSHGKANDEAAVAKMRAALLLDTEERTDNEGGIE